MLKSSRHNKQLVPTPGTTRHVSWYVRGRRGTAARWVSIQVNPMLHPGEFQVNEAWIVFKLNEAPIATERDGDFNVIALMDAASCFILGGEFVPATSREASEMEVKRLIKSGKAHKQQLPKTLYIPENLAADVLCTEAERNGIVVVRIPEEQLLVFIGEARKGLKEHIGGGSVQ